MFDDLNWVDIVCIDIYVNIIVLVGIWVYKIKRNVIFFFFDYLILVLWWVVCEVEIMFNEVNVL